MLTVPACYQCQRIKEGGDADLEIYVNLDIFGALHPESTAHLQKILLRNDKTRKWLTKVFDRALVIPLTTEQGIQLSECLEAEFNSVRIRTSMALAARGIHFLQFGTALSRNIESHSYIVPWNQRIELLERLQGHFRGDAVERGQNLLVIRQFDTSGDPNEDALWAVSINNGVLILIGTGIFSQHLNQWNRKADNLDFKSQIVQSIQLPKNADGEYLIP